MLSTCGEEFNFVLYLDVVFSLQNSTFLLEQQLLLNIQLLNTSKWKFPEETSRSSYCSQSPFEMLFFTLLSESSSRYTPDIRTTASTNFVQGSQAHVRCLFFLPAHECRCILSCIFVSWFCHFLMQPKEKLTNSLHSSQYSQSSHSLWPQILVSATLKYALLQPPLGLWCLIWELLPQK